MNTETHEIAIAYPAGSEVAAIEGIKQIRDAKNAAIGRIKANAAEITDDNYADERLNAFDGEEKSFKAAADALSDAAAKATHVKELLVNLAAARNEVKAEIAARQAVIYKFKAAHEPPAPKHTYVLMTTCTDATLNAIIKSAVKAGAEGMVATTAQSDKAVKQIEKWFGENL